MQNKISKHLHLNFRVYTESLVVEKTGMTKRDNEDCFELGLYSGALLNDNNPFQENHL